MEKASLPEQMKPFFRNEQSTNLALTLLANNELSIETLIELNTLVVFASVAKKKEFKDTTFSYKGYRVNEEDNCPNESGELTFEEEENINVATLKKIMAEMIETAKDGGGVVDSNFLNLNLEKQFITRLREEKIEKRRVEEQKISGALTMPLEQYLSQFLKNIFEILQIFDGDQIINKLLSNQPFVSCYHLFNQNKPPRVKLELILKNSRSYQKFVKWGGKDNTELKRKFEKYLIKALNFTEEINLQIFKELTTTPLSLIVANHNGLTNQQKKSFFNSQLYTQGILLEYYNAALYDECLQFKSREDMVKIVGVIEEAGKIADKSVLDALLSYNIEDILRNENLKSLKKRLYFYILKDCPDYFKAYEQIQIVDKDLESLKIQQQASLKLQLRAQMLENDLQFEFWEKLQKAFMDQRYDILDECPLCLKEKFEFKDFVCSKLKPYFKQKNCPYNYDQRIKKNLLEMLLNERFTQKNDFDQILEIVDALMENESSVAQIGQMSLKKTQQNDFKKCVEANKQLAQYIASKKKDLSQISFEKGLQLQKKINEINLEEQVYVTTQKINQFIEVYIKNKFNIPNSYPHYICNLAKLKGEPEKLETTFEENIGGGVTNNGEATLEDNTNPQEQKIKLLTEVNQYLTTNCEQTPITAIRASKFAGNEQGYIQKIFEKWGKFEELKDYLGISGLQSKKLIEILQKDPLKTYLGSKAATYKQISAKITKGSSSTTVPQGQSGANTKNIQNKKEEIVNGFYEKYTQSFPESAFETVVNAVKSKGQINMKQLIVGLLTQNVLETVECPFYNFCSKLQKNKVFKEFTQEPNANFIRGEIAKYRGEA